MPCWDFVNGYFDCLIEVKIRLIKGINFWGLRNYRLIWCHLIQVLLYTIYTNELACKDS